MDRRAFLGTLGILASPPLSAEAQPDQTVRKVGVINTNAPSRTPGLEPAFWVRMRELGWIEGKTFVVEFRDALGDAARGLVQNAAREMVQLKVDIIIMNNGSAARRVQEITRTVPVCVFGADLPAAGVVASLARPGSNVTGVQAFQSALVGKRMALLKEVVPRLTGVVVLMGTRSSPTNMAILRAAEEAGRTLRLQVHVVESLLTDDLELTFSRLTRGQTRAMLIVNNPSITSRQSQVVALASKSRLAAIYEYRPWTEMGGLMSYGPVISDGYRQLADCADKILRGAKPADLPVQQPTKFELTINLKTAKALGLTIPPSLLQRADQVIE